MAQQAWREVGVEVLGCAVIGSLLSDPHSEWYKSLRKPSWQPPPIAFPLVWTSLYALIAVASSSAITRLQHDHRTADADGLRRALGVNLVLNAGWSGLFFRAHNPVVATVGAAALAASSADVARRAAAAGPKQAVALGAYVGWYCFATALSGEIARLNPAGVRAETYGTVG